MYNLTQDIHVSVHADAFQVSLMEGDKGWVETRHIEGVYLTLRSGRIGILAKLPHCSQELSNGRCPWV